MSGVWLVLPTYNEAENIGPLVRAVLPPLASAGIEHHVLRGSADLLQLLPDVVRHYGEPSADKSIIR